VQSVKARENPTALEGEKMGMIGRKECKLENNPKKKKE
jgi:hypothetical protein